MTERFILESFWQKAANCVCIALIKAALLKYGMRSMFYCRRINDHYLVTLRDGTMLVLNDTEIDRINGTNKLMFRRYAEAQQKKWLKRLKAHVHLSFAIMVRQIQLKGFDGMEYTESEAKKLLTAEGMETDHALKLLGLTRKTKTAHLFKRKTPAALMKKRSAILYSDTHIAAASNGNFDNYGKATALVPDPPTLRGRKADHWYELKW